jgi:superfamily II DNA helicase RecQ
MACSSDCWVNGSPSENCAAESKLRRVLNNTFKHSQFLPGQLKALLPLSDVFVHMRTGGGKSLCMFVVPLAIGGEAMGVVISPLVGLMEQQVSVFPVSPFLWECSK